MKLVKPGALYMSKMKHPVVPGHAGKSVALVVDYNSDSYVVYYIMHEKKYVLSFWDFNMLFEKLESV